MKLKSLNRHLRKNPAGHETARRAWSGFSLGETLVALLIVSLLSMGIATGVAFAARQYNRALVRSEARILCSTLTNIFREELGNTQTIDTNPANDSIRFFSSNYTPPGAHGEENRFLSSIYSVRYQSEETYTAGANDAEYGQIIFRTYDASGSPIDRMILPLEAYVPVRDLRAKATVKYDGDTGKNGVFEVTLNIRAGEDTQDQVTSTFYVIPLNKPTIASDSE